MGNNDQKPVSDKGVLGDGRGLYDIVLDVSALALALARTYEKRRPRARKGRLHSV